MKVIAITEPSSGERLQMLVDRDEMPLLLPTEFSISRRHLSPNTIQRQLKEIGLLYRWLESRKICLWERIRTGRSLTETEITSGIFDSLRLGAFSAEKGRQSAVTAKTFNQRLATIRQYLSWCFDKHLTDLPLTDSRYERIRDAKQRVIDALDRGFISSPPSPKFEQKGLTDEESVFLTNAIHPESQGFGSTPAIKYRNYIAMMIMLSCGLRPGELLSLRVTDVEFGANSAIKVIRRPADPDDPRRPRPQIKRNGRIIILGNHKLARDIRCYITTHREKLKVRWNRRSKYLLLNDEGKPWHQKGLNQMMERLRRKFPDDLPKHLSPKALRHTFSSQMERRMRRANFEEQERRETLARLRGDSNTESQNEYILQEKIERCDEVLREYQRQLGASA